MALTRYRYELRDGDAIAATGHISYDSPLEVGQQVTIGRTRGVVRDLGPSLADGELRLVVQLFPVDSDEPS